MDGHDGVGVTISQKNSSPARQRSSSRAIPPNVITPDCTAITPRMLPLVSLDENQIEQIVSTVPGGVTNIQDIYPLTPLQEGMVFDHMLDRHKNAYTLVTLLELESRVHRERFVDALQKVIDRHDVLRSAMLWEGLSQPVQVVYRHAMLPVEETVLDRHRPPIEQVEEWLTGEGQWLDLVKAPLMRLRIAGNADSGCWYALLQFHHAILDHESLALVCAEVAAHMAGCPQKLPEPMLYRDHVAKSMALARSHHAKTFFRRALQGIDGPSAPFGLLHSEGNWNRGKRAFERLDRTLAVRVRATARRLRVNIAALFHAAWGVVVAQTSGRDDVVFGTVLLGRMQMGAAAQQRIGMFLNTLPLRLRLRDVTVQEFVEKTHRGVLELLSYEQTSLAQAQRCSDITGSIPLFSSLLNYRRSTSSWGWADIPGVRELAVVDGTSYPIVVSVDDLGEDFTVTAQTDARIDPGRMTGYFCTALQSLVAAVEEAPQTSPLSLSILPQGERQQVLERFNETQAPYPAGKRVHELFEEQVARTPDAIALVYEEQRLTYAQLNSRANRLAQYLQQRGVGCGHLVALHVERGADLVVALLGILKSGAAYVPLDPSYPAERLAYMLRDAAPRVVLTQSCLKGSLPPSAAEVVELDGNWVTEQGITGLNLTDTGMSARGLAYVMYTSGSTGHPKGVMVEHTGVVNFLCSMQDKLDVRSGDRMLSVTTVSFDIAGLEIYLPLCQGATVVLARREDAHDAHRLIEKMEASEITLMQATPATWQMLLSEGWTGRPTLKALCGGEALSTEVSRKLKTLVKDLWNLYGPTETTIWSCAHHIDRQETCLAPVEPLGTPIANTRIYILGRTLQPVPIGAMGEIFIGGAGVARGYLNRPDLTGGRFMADPLTAAPGARLYRTGDLGRWRSDGTIEFLGRNDDQVKIRGHRIELGEIEAHLCRHEGVRQAVVVSRSGTRGERSLVAYVTRANSLSRGEELSPEVLRLHLLEKLPAYMVPSALVILERFPLTPNGKLDRRSLPAPDLADRATREYEAPKGEIEGALAAIWAEALELERIGATDNFFDLGGHSLLGQRVIALVARRLGVRAPVATIFQYPTLREMAGLVEDLLPAGLLPVESSSTERDEGVI